VINAIQEIGAGIGVVAAAVVMGVVATATGDVAPLDVILREWGPLGVAVAVLYRRVDKLEERSKSRDKRVTQNERDINDLEDEH